MAELTDADVQRILELVDKSHFDFFQLTIGDLQLTLSKEGVPLGATSPAPPAPPAQVSPPSAAPRAEAPPPPSAAASPSVAPSVPQPASERGPHADNLVPVLAPMVGVFYRAPAPDAPPFVQVDSPVEAETTLGLVEAMKVYTGIVAGVQGVVAEILVENGQFVEYGQPVFLIRPQASEQGGAGAR